MTKRRDKIKSSNKSRKTSSSETSHAARRGGAPVLQKWRAPSHHVPGEPIGINYSVDRSDFDPDFHPADFLKHCQEGAFRAEICAAWGISLSTLAAWRKEHPEFAAVYEKGKAAQQAWILRNARKAAFEGVAKNNGTLIIFLAKNVANLGDEPRSDFEDVGEDDLDLEFEKDDRRAV